jgi:hypothetical protein
MCITYTITNPESDVAEPRFLVQASIRTSALVRPDPRDRRDVQEISANKMHTQFPLPVGIDFRLVGAIPVSNLAAVQANTGKGWHFPRISSDDQSILEEEWF